MSVSEIVSGQEEATVAEVVQANAENAGWVTFQERTDAVRLESGLKHLNAACVDLVSILSLGEELRNCMYNAVDAARVLATFAANELSRKTGKPRVEATQCS